MKPDYVWRQLEQLLASARRRVVLVAPFIKKDVFKAILATIGESEVEVLVITRWSVMEVAAGVSDPEIADLAEQDGRTNILLCHDLHAKLYLSDERCLVGSANLTATATGRRRPQNLELLLEVGESHPEVQRVLEEARSTGTQATREMAHQIREQANLIANDEDSPNVVIVTGEADRENRSWRPETRSPNRLYRVYRGSEHDYVSEIFAGVVRDLAHLDIPPGLDELAFSKAVLSRLYKMPEVEEFVIEGRLNMSDLQQRLLAADGCTGAQAQRAAENICEWLKYFDEVRVVPTGPWEIRQGRELG